MITIELKDKTVIKDVGLVRFADNGLGIYYYLRLPNCPEKVIETPVFINFRNINQIKYAPRTKFKERFNRFIEERIRLASSPQTESAYIIVREFVNSTAGGTTYEQP